MQTRDPEPVEQSNRTQHPVGEMPGGSSPTQPSLWSGWRGPAIGALLAVIVVFAVLDLGRILFPQRLHNASSTIIIKVQNLGGDTSSSMPAALAASPKSLDLRCGGSTSFVLTNKTSYGIHWTLDTVSDGIALSANSPRGGGLAPGAHTTLQVVSLGRSTSATLHFTEDRGSTLDVAVNVQC